MLQIRLVAVVCLCLVYTVCYRSDKWPWFTYVWYILYVKDQISGRGLPMSGIYDLIKGNILQLVLLVLNTFHTEIQAACSPGWFGSKCQYMCHCSTDATCDVTGQCPSQCASGWFGLGCQYQDLSIIPGATVTTSPTQTTTTWLTDGSDTNCNTDTNIQLVKISWNTAYPFTWLRLQIKDSSVKIFNVTFKTINSLTSTCSGLQIFELDATTVDYRCDLNETIQELTVTGTGLKSLCSLFVSGGKNVALKQESSQSSTHDKAFPMLAVDGNTNGIFTKGSCAHTSEFDPTPSWTLALDTPKVVNRFVLYNRDPSDCCSDRLRYFRLETLDINNNILWTYQDTRETLQVYTVTSVQRYPVCKVRITPTNSINNQVVLTLCEVMVFGDCIPGTWGLECNETCPRKCNNTSCNQDTGVCPLGCEKGFWGDFCQNSCSVNCYNKTCDKKTGVCDNGCIGFSNPPICTVECLQDRWGQDCKNICSNNCYDGSCNKLTGVCDKGCNGFSNPPICTAECSTGRWGPNCKFSCRSNCFNNSCDRFTGTCDNGCNGYMDPNDCLVECKKSQWGHNCANNCSTKCFLRQCNRVTGLCDQICDGRINSSCPSDCPNGFYGDNCTMECSSTCKDLTCSGLGYCISCPPDYRGHFCEKAAMKTQESITMTFEAGIGVGISVGVVVVVLIDIIIVMVQRARYNKHKQNSASRQGTQLESYDGIRPINEYNHSYETSGKPANTRDLKIPQKTNHYENSSSVYETISEPNKD
ncbi:hypothetical protein Btru_017716 [Bulinus truncatus]|nr:hypothetical protein Btru_017716 [Bulinus truncatus]